MNRIGIVICLGLLIARCALSDERSEAARTNHWAFQALEFVNLPPVRQQSVVRAPVDNFIQSELEQQDLRIGPAANRNKLLRRLSLDLIGLPPPFERTAEELADTAPHAYEKAIDRLLASPRYGERWGKFWLDAAGYADSNGYFNADTDRPLAYKYRDYVIRAWNADKPYHQFVREQLAGDEIDDGSPDGTVTPRTVELRTATHFLRNSQDGSSESDGNPAEVTVDRATVLEGTLQVTMNTLLGMTIQCARCHGHKFEPIEHAEYYQLQAVFYPAFPFFHREKWVGPVQRVSHVAMPDELAVWERDDQQRDAEIEELRHEFAKWLRDNRPAGAVRFLDNFDGPDATLNENWSHVAPHDDAAGNESALIVDSGDALGARIRDHALEIVVASEAAKSRWLSTKTAIDWTPDREGDSVQLTFDLISDTISPADNPAARIGFYVALHDFNDSSPTPGGNVLIDGNPAGGAAVHVDYPGTDTRDIGSIGTSGYQPGRNYGVRITNVGNGEFRLEQLADWVPEENVRTLTAEDLPDGGLGFEFCCGRSFIVDNVIVESWTVNPDSNESNEEFLTQVQQRRKKRDDSIQTLNDQRREKPGALAFVTDLMTPAPDVHLLERGAYAHPAQVVEPAGLSVLMDDPADFQLPTSANIASSGRRLALANWMTRPKSRPAALLSRVMVNRIWQHHFGRGLVTTVDNFGQSGAPPSHPELLDYLAHEFIRSGWSVKALHRRIVRSAVFRQSSEHDGGTGWQADPENRLLWRFPLRRLEAEAIRDSMLAVSGELDGRMFGSYVPTQQLADGNVVVDESRVGARRRGVYLQQRRTQMNSLLSLFDAPSMSVTCGRRDTSTVPLQSLALLNSGFVRSRSAALAKRIIHDIPADDSLRILHAFQLGLGRVPEAAERQAAMHFFQRQIGIYQGSDLAGQMALADLCQMLFASNAFLYME